MIPICQTVGLNILIRSVMPQLRWIIMARGVGSEDKDRQKGRKLEIGDILMKNGITFAGIDMIGEYLTEINITSPTCAREILDQTKLNPIKEYFEGL